MLLSEWSGRRGGSLRFWGPGLLSTSPAFSMSSASHSAGSSGWLAQKNGSWAHFPVGRESRCNLSIQIESSKATACRLHPSLSSSLSSSHSRIVTTQDHCPHYTVALSPHSITVLTTQQHCHRTGSLSSPHSSIVPTQYNCPNHTAALSPHSITVLTTQ